MNTMHIITHLLFSLSLISFLFSSYTLYSSPFSARPMLSSRQWIEFLCSKLELFPSSWLFTAAMNKNFWFLIFNGLLVILAKISGFTIPVGPPTAPADDLGFRVEAIPMGPNEDLGFRVHANDAGPAQSLGFKVRANDVGPMHSLRFGVEDIDMEVVLEVSESGPTFEKGPAAAAAAEAVVEEREVILGREGPEIGDGLTIECDVEEVVGDDRDFDGDHDQDHDDDGIGEESGDEAEMMSTEELNKKFEEFIKRMKEEIRVDEIQQYYQQQLVVVK
ncbi:uncharacterized protein LOC127253359 [Andrographis paniculata]|uniref:uncharacterized protein LOC127253359 n=1 Tax=Andrographis paniculata TaxID=175694 RepID=UPI0021E6E2D6|nr:uncharacterized protein LOC127253359 [Andrographis paniculata]